MGRTVQTARKSKKSRKYDHKYSNAPRPAGVPRSLGAGTPPGAVKYLTTTPVFSGVSDSPAELAANTCILNIAAIPKGVGAQERKYNKALLKSVAIRGNIAATATSDVSMPGVLMLVYDRNRNQRSTLAISDILAADALGAFTEQSLTEPNGAPRFKVLRRWPFVIQPTAGTNGLPSVVHIDTFVNLKNKTISWINTDTVGASANAMDGPLYLVIVSSSQGVAQVAKAPKFSGSTRLYFADPA